MGKVEKVAIIMIKVISADVTGNMIELNSPIIYNIKIMRIILKSRLPITSYFQLIYVRS